MTIASVILAIAVIIAIMLSRGKTMKKKYIIWGITTMVAIAPLFSWIVSRLYAISEGSGWAGGILMMVMFPILFIVGLVFLLIGFLKKDKSQYI